MSPLNIGGYDAAAHPNRVRPRVRVVDAQRAAKVARINQIRDADCNNGNMMRAMLSFDRLMLSVDSTCEIETPEGMLMPPDGAEGWAQVITGPSLAGKSNVLNRIVRHPDFVYSEDDYGPCRPLVAVSAPAPATLKTMASILLEAMKQPPVLAREPEHLALHRLRKALREQSVLVVLIDEFHHALIGRTTTEREKLAETMKNLMKGQPLLVPKKKISKKDRVLIEDQTIRNPVHLILAGTPNLAIFARDRSTDSGDQFANKCEVEPFEEMPVARDKDGNVTFKGLPEFVRQLVSDMGFEEAEADALLTPDMQARLYKAGCKQFGRVANVIKKAAERAVHEGGGATIVSKLAAAFEAIYTTGTDRNVFKVADVARCRVPPEPKREATAADFGSNGGGM